MELKFKEWLKLEDGTSTASIAGFARPIMTTVNTRKFPDVLNVDGEKKPTKKKKKKS